MKPIKKIIFGSLGRISPEIAEHSLQLGIETYVAGVHFINSRRCRSRFRRSKDLRVNIGCGPYRKEGFLNLDFSKTADSRLDLRKDLPLPNESCQLVFSEHFVEHLSYPEGVERFFSGCIRVLKPGGIISLSVPDTDWPIQTYGKEQNDWIASARENGWHPSECSTYMEHLNYHFRQRWRGRGYGHFENHRFAWDYPTLRKKLSECGFVDIKRRQFDDLIDSPHRKTSLFVEASKPL